MIPPRSRTRCSRSAQGGTKCQTFKACLDLLKAGTDIDYDGASGPVDLTARHEPGNGVYDVWAYDAKGAPANVPGRRRSRSTADRRGRA